MSVFFLSLALLAADIVPPGAPENLRFKMAISIPIAADIVSRQTGVAPLAIFFDATGVTSDATSYPFHDCYFSWDFGDTGSGNWSTNGKSKNHATGGVAAHVYETAGNYTAILTVKDSTGATATRTIGIQVISADVQWSGTKTICFSQSGNFEGAPSGSLQITTSDWTVVRSYVAADRRLLLLRGETWYLYDHPTYMYNSGPGMIGVFGSGSEKVTLSKTARNSAFILAGTNDWRFCDINLIGSRYSDEGYVDDDDFFQSDYPLNSNLLMLRLNSTANATSRQVYLPDSQGGPILADKIFIVDSTFKYSTAHEIYVCAHHLAFLGVVAGETHTTPVRILHTNYCAIQACYFYDPGRSFSPYGGGGGVVLKMHDQWYITGVTSTRWVNISDSTLKEKYGETESYAWGGLEIAPANNFDPSFWGRVYPETCEHMEDILVERNLLIVNFGGNTIIGNRKLTIRNNVFRQQPDVGSNFNAIQLQFYNNTCQTDNENIWIYNNTVYSAEPRNDRGNWPCIIYSANTNPVNLIVRNNFGSFPNNWEKYIIYGPYTTESNNQLSDTPGFIDPANNNFHLASGSPAINSGYNISTLFDDKDELVRSGTYEKGAYQFGENFFYLLDLGNAVDDIYVNITDITKIVIGIKRS